MTIADIATGVLGLLGLIGGVFTVLKLTYKRGGDERIWVSAIEDNTTANKELAASFRDFKDTAVAQMHQQAINHERLAAEVAVIREQLKKVL